MKKDIQDCEKKFDDRFLPIDNTITKDIKLFISTLLKDQTDKWNSDLEDLINKLRVYITDK